MRQQERLTVRLHLSSEDRQSPRPAYMPRGVPLDRRPCEKVKRSLAKLNLLPPFPALEAEC